MLDRRAIEAAASGLYVRAGTDPLHPPGPVALAWRLLGRDHVLRDAALRADGAWCPHTRTIRVRPGLVAPKLAVVLAHEMGEMICDDAGERAAARELVANALGAAILVPAAALRRMLARGVRDLAQLARGYVATQTLLALRLGEVTGEPVCVVTPNRLFFRGKPYRWPEEFDLRAGHGRGLRRVPLTDAPHERVAVFAV